MTKLLDLTKPLQIVWSHFPKTTSPVVRVLARDLKNPSPLVVTYESGSQEHLISFPQNGEYKGMAMLENIPEEPRKVTRWFIVYNDDFGDWSNRYMKMLYPCKEQAEAALAISEKRGIGVQKIEITEQFEHE
jgi:hypothetical protein